MLLILLLVFSFCHFRSFSLDYLTTHHFHSLHNTFFSPFISKLCVSLTVGIFSTSYHKITSYCHNWKSQSTLETIVQNNMFNLITFIGLCSSICGRLVLHMLLPTPFLCVLLLVVVSFPLQGFFSTTTTSIYTGLSSSNSLMCLYWVST